MKATTSSGGEVASLLTGFDANAKAEQLHAVAVTTTTDNCNYDDDDGCETADACQPHNDPADLPSDDGVDSNEYPDELDALAWSAVDDAATTEAAAEDASALSADAWDEYPLRYPEDRRGPLKESKAERALRSQGTLGTRL